MADPFEMYFRAYASAFDEFDADRIASFFECPCMMVNGEYSASLTTNEAILNSMRSVLQYHRASGYKRAVVSDFDITVQAENLAIVRVCWRIYDRDDALLWNWMNTYNLTDYGLGWKILVSTTHQDL